MPLILYFIILYSLKFNIIHLNGIFTNFIIYYKRALKNKGTRGYG